MKKTIKISVFAIHRPYRAPNEKYRWMQFYPFIQDKYQVEYLYLLNEKQDKILFHSKNHLLKIWIYLFTFFKRTYQIISLKPTDTIIIYRELHWFHCPLWTSILKIKSKKIIYDFDDAIFLPHSNVLYNIVRQPSNKFIHFVKKANIVIAGNDYLNAHSSKYNANSIVIPTVVDTTYFVPIHSKRHQKDKVVIGWMGSHSTLSHLLHIIEVLKNIQTSYPFVEFKFVATKTFIPELSIYTENWNLHTEVDTLNTFDIGIMPLPDDEWSKGKCGLKILTYMACEIPCIASRVGVNPQIIEKTKGGILASHPDEWINALSELIENKEKRIAIGKAGRIGVEKYYSVKQWKDTFLNTLL